MPNIGSPFSGFANDRKLTDAELRAIRFMVAAEYQELQLFMQLVESSDYELAQKVLKEITDDEHIHASEFQRLLDELAPDEKSFNDDRDKEVEEYIEK